MRENRFKERDYQGERPMDIWHRQFFATIEDDKAALLTRQIIGEIIFFGGPIILTSIPPGPVPLRSLVKCSKESIRVFMRKITYDNVKRLYGIEI